MRELREYIRSSFQGTGISGGIFLKISGYCIKRHTYLRPFIQHERPFSHNLLDFFLYVPYTWIVYIVVSINS